VSGVLQGSVIGPLLFLFYVNDLRDWIRNELKMFADDTKFWSRIKAVADSTILQQGLDSVCRWSDKWQLRFNVQKCKLVHIGHSLPTDYYMTEGTQKVSLKTVQEETDLGVVIRSDPKPTSQCNKSAAAARRIIAMVRRHFKKLDVEDFLLIYKTYIRPRLEFCIQSWSPYLHKDIETLERVQRTATRLVPQLRKFCYEERLRKLGLTTLKERRLQGDMIEVFKLLGGWEKIDYRQFFFLATNLYNTRGHNQRLYVSRSDSRLRQMFFSQRVVQHWNRLPQSVIEAPSVNSFKNCLDAFWAKDMGV